MSGFFRNSAIEVLQNPFLQSDWVTRFLLVRLRLKLWIPTLIFLIVLCFPIYIGVLVNDLYIVDPIACTKHNYFFPNVCARVGLSNDYPWYWYQFISWPATIVFFFWLPQGIFGAINGLRKNKVLVISYHKGPKDRDTLTEFVNRFARSYSHPIWLVVSFFVLVVFMGFIYVPNQAQYAEWTTTDLFVFVSAQLAHAVTVYILFLVVVRASVAVVWFNLLFKRFEVDVNYLHPDRAGGIFPFGRLLVKAGYLIGIYGFTVLVWSFDAEYSRGVLSFTIPPEVIPMIIIYFLFAPTLFFVSLNSAHLAMKKERDKFILNISKQYENRMQCLDLALEKSDLIEAKSNTEVLEQLKKMYNIALDYPAWPLDTRNVFRFYTSYLAPIAFAVSLAFIIKLLAL
jgi:hypothetical protein